MSKNLLSDEYILTTSLTEEARLKRQHDLWLEDTRSLWRRARLSREQSILEIGAGPGFTTLDLARFVGASSQITAIELSANFAEKCAERVKDYANVTVVKADLLEIDLGVAQYDAVFGRWIWMFLPNLEFVLEKILKCLRPGGVLCFQEYVDYNAMNLSPAEPVMETVKQAITKSFRDAGGEPDVIKKLLPFFEKNHLEIELLEANGKLIRPRDPFWDWPTEWYQSYLPTLLSKGYLNAAQVKAFETVWNDCQTVPGTFWTSPTVASLIARKKS
jgi:SAM-dependent methyltransferase